MDQTNNVQDFSEDIDYQKTGDQSIWGGGDPATIRLLKKYPMSGTWLNLAAGDGRYNNAILTKADQVIATDIDTGALAKLLKTTPDKLKNKLQIKQQDITQPFPFPDQFFDGVFSTGTLHQFSPPVLKSVFAEISRVTKTKGQIFIDFATDIKRVKPDKTLLIFPKETSYSLKQAQALFPQLLKDYTYSVSESSVPPEKVEFGKTSYIFSCKFFIVIGKKK